MLSVWVFQTAGGCTISQQLPSDSLVVPNDSLVTPPRSHRAPQRAVIPTHSCLTITGLLRVRSACSIRESLQPMATTLGNQEMDAVEEGFIRLLP